MHKDELDISFEVCRPIESHAQQVMDWRNDPDTLWASYHSTPKVWDEFWPEFRDTYFLETADIQPVFALIAGLRQGFLRFSRVQHPAGLTGRCVEIAINLAPGARGKGLGPRILRAALQHLLVNGVDTVYAEVLAKNTRSAKTFSKAGFTVIGDSSKFIADTGETHSIRRFLANLVAPYWRQKPVYIIAEAGSNWRMGTPKRDLAMARALIDVAADAGANAVKFQTYKPESVYVENAGQSEYLSEAGIKDDIRDIFADLSMPYEMLPKLAEYCRGRGIDFMSTPFSPSDFAAIDPHVAVHKIASYEISHPHLIRLAAQSKKPLVLSTGASNEADIAWAVDTFRASGGLDMCLLQCTAKYPAPMSSLNLATIPWLRRRFGVATGLSDHSREPALAPVMAVALGARVIEKHYTFDNRLPGPDHSFAITASELATLVQGVRLAEEALGDGAKRVLPAEEELADYARRGLQATRAINPGEILREGVNFAVLRPGKQKLGIHPRHTPRVEGQTATRPIPPGHGLSLDDVNVNADGIARIRGPDISVP
jgi:sialic acid synthase SpsE/RimJ/RimL family protein N-acetyltransferase